MSLQVRCYWDWRMWWVEHNRAIPLMHTGSTQLASVVTMKLEVGVLSQALRPPHRCLTKSLRPCSTAIDGRKALFIFPCTYPRTWIPFLELKKCRVLLHELYFATNSPKMKRFSEGGVALLCAIPTCKATLAAGSHWGMCHSVSNC